MTTIFGRTALALAMTIGLMAAPALAQDAPVETDALPEVPELVLGPEDAKVTVVEYASYTCPHCANFHKDVFKQLKTDYIDTGKIRFVFREVYFDRYGLWASMMARCGGDMKYFAISGMLFEDMSKWAETNDPAVAIENIKTIGRAAGIDSEQLETCLKDQKFAEAMIAKFEKDAAEDEVEGTPTLIINGEKHPNMSYDELKAIIDGKLAE